MLNCFKDYKIYIHILNCTWIWLSTQLDEMNSGTTIHVVCSTQPILCLLIFWGLKEPEHQQAWYWPPKPEYSASSIRRVNSLGPHAACRAEAWDCLQPAVLISLARLAVRHHAGYNWLFRALVLPPKLVILPKHLWFYDIWVLFVKILTWMASTNIDTQTSTKNTLT